MNSFLDALARANGRASLWLARLAAVALAIIALVTFGDVIGRYFFHAPFAFTVELTQMLMAIVVFFGVGLVTHEDAHISADVVTLRLPPRWRAAVAAVTNLLALCFLAILTWRLWGHAEFLYGKGDTTMVWTVPLWPVAFAVALGVLVFVHELGHFMVAKRLGILVQRFSIGFGPVVFARRRGETEYALSAMPLGGYVKMLGEEDETDPAVVAEPERAFSTQPARRRAAIVFAGPAMNFVFAFVVYAVLFATVGAEMPSHEARIGGVTAGMPAEHAGLKPDDRVIAIDDRPIATWEELSHSVLGSEGRRLRLTVERDGQQTPIEVTPELRDNRTMFGEDAGRVYRIGIEASRDWTSVSPPRAVLMAAQQTWSASAVVLKGLLLMLQGRVSPSELGGPIAIARAAGQQARAGARYFLTMLAFLSINLGVLNLLPIPALDGGHLAFFGIEGLLRRPLRQRHRELAQQVGLLLLITLMVFVFYNDIHRLVQG